MKTATDPKTKRERPEPCGLKEGGCYVFLLTCMCALCPENCDDDDVDTKKGELKCVPVLLPALKNISKLRLYIPKEVKSKKAREEVWCCYCRYFVILSFFFSVVTV